MGINILYINMDVLSLIMLLTSISFIMEIIYRNGLKKLLPYGIIYNIGIIR